MRSISVKALALVATMMAFTALLAPGASAQNYAPVLPSTSTVQSATDQELLDAIVAFRDGTADQVLGVSVTAGATGAAGSTADEVLGTSVSASGLAVTGSSTSLPVAAGAALIGAGGLALLAARKREQNQ